MRKFLISLAVLLTSFTASAQITPTYVRADQVRVTTNGLHYARYNSLQTDIVALDSNVFLLNGVVLTPQALSNLVAAATANSVYDLMESFPALVDPSTAPALVPPTTTLNVGSLSVSGALTTSVLVADSLVVGGTPVYGTVDSTVADVVNATNVIVVCSTNQWAFPIAPSNAFQTVDCIATNGRLQVLSDGLYSVSYNATIYAGGTSNWGMWLQTTTISGSIFSNACTILPVTSGAPATTVFLANFSYPLSAGGTVRAIATFLPASTNSVSIVGGGVMAISKTVLKDSTGGIISNLPKGGW